VRDGLSKHHDQFSRRLVDLELGINDYHRTKT